MLNDSFFFINQDLLIFFLFFICDSKRHIRAFQISFASAGTTELLSTMSTVIILFTDVQHMGILSCKNPLILESYLPDNMHIM